MDLSKLIEGLKLDHVAKTSGIPIATLWRWKEKNAIPGHPDVQAVQLKRIQKAVRRLKAKADA
jgi:predicted transcriptional regulator